MRFPALLCFILLQGCSTAGYLMETTVGQFKLFNKARPVAEVLESPRTSPATVHGIQVVKQAKAFAGSDLGMKITKNYETFVQLDGPCLSWAVSASDPLALVEKKWKFPIVGEVPYLGFFTKEGADKEAARLKEKESPAPDTWVRCVPAFSSLGWFADPLYSSMINGKDHQIVELIVHESLHATVWVGNSVDFNEKLANFVGLEGSVRWMQKEKGEAGVAQVREEVVGEKVFADFMHSAVERYKKTVKDLSGKETFYRELLPSYEAFVKERQKTQKFSPVPAKFANWNNAALMAYGNYYSDMSVFEKLLKKCEANLGRFVGWIKTEQDRGEKSFREEPEAYMAKMLETKSCP